MFFRILRNIGFSQNVFFHQKKGACGQPEGTQKKVLSNNTIKRTRQRQRQGQGQDKDKDEYAELLLSMPNPCKNIYKNIEFKLKTECVSDI